MTSVFSRLTPRLRRKKRELSSSQGSIASNISVSDREVELDGDGVNNGDLSGIAALPQSSPGTDHMSLTSPSNDEAMPQADMSSGEKVSPMGATPFALPPRLHVSSPSEAASNDIPTDMGDTTEDDEEITCGHHQHSGILALDEVFHMGVEHLFNCIFSDGPWQQSFLKARKTHDVVIPPWPDEGDVDGSKSRVVTYTLSLNYSIGPKSSPSTEKQTILGHSKPGRVYVVDTEVVNGGIPYGENFFVANRYCITKISSQKTRLMVHCEIKYKKHVWGLVKNFIEKNASSGLLENYSIMCEHLHKEADKISSHIGASSSVAVQPSKKKRIRRRRCTSANSEVRGMGLKKTGADPGRIPSSTPIKASISKEEWPSTFQADTVVRFFCFILVLLVMLNALLFYKLYSLERKADTISFQRQTVFPSSENQPQSQDEWMELLKQQHSLHQQEIGRWKDVLSTSAQLMEQMKSSLEALHQTIDQRSEFMANWKVPNKDAK